MIEQVQNYAQNLEQNWDIYWAEKQAKFEEKLSGLDLNAQTKRLDTLLNGLISQREDVTSEDVKKTLAQDAMLKAADAFSKRITGLLTEFNETESSTRKTEIVDEIFEACEKYQLELVKIAPLADPDNYHMYVAIVILTVLVVELLIAALKIGLVMAICSPSSPFFGPLIGMAVISSLYSDFTHSIRLLEAFHLIDVSKTTYPIPGTERWNNTVNNLRKEWYRGSKQYEKEREDLENLVPNMLTSVISKIMKFFFGDSGNFLKERKTGHDIAEQIKSTLTTVSTDNPERMFPLEQASRYAYDSVFASNDRADKPEPTINSNALQQFNFVNFLNVIK